MALMGSGAALEFLLDPTGGRYPRFPLADSVFIGTTTPGVEQAVFAYTVPVGKTLYVAASIIVCRMEGESKMLVEGAQFGSGRTGAAHPRDVMEFYPPQIVAEGETLDVKFTSRASSPAVPLEGYIHGFLLNN